MNIKDVVRRLDFGVAFQRWPIASIISVIVSFVLVSWISQDNLSDQNTSTYLRTVLSLYIGFLVAIAIPLAFGTKQQLRLRHIITAAISLLAIGIWYFILPSDITAQKHETYWLGYAYPFQIAILHLLISVAGFWRKGANELDFRFWNVQLLKVVLEGLLFVLVLMVGLSLALLALEHLFGFDINEKPYLYLTVILLGIFHPWFVLSKTAINLQEEHNNRNIEGFRILTQYVLIPIVMLYMTILYLYGIKILIEGSLPQGWLGKLSLGFCGISLLTYLLNSHVKEHSKKQISRLFHRWIPLVLIIPIVLLLIAIFRRIQDYGITENRYLVAGIAICILLISMAYSFKKNLHIKWIPISLLLMLLLQLGSGPLNIFNATIRSQLKRLTATLDEAGLLDNGVLINRPDSSSTFLDLSSLQFLSNRLDLKSLSFFHGDQVDWASIAENEDQFSFVIEQYHLQNQNISRAPDYIYFQSEKSEIIEISMFDKALPFRYYEHVKNEKVQIQSDQLQLKITLEDNSTFELKASELYDLHQHRNKEGQELPIIIESNSRFKLSISEYQIQVDKNIPKITQCSGILFYNSKH